MGIDFEPAWYDGHRLNELMFCQEFLEEHGLRCIGNSLFTVDGRVVDENRLKKEILNRIGPYVKSNIVQKVNALMAMMKLEAFALPPPRQLDRIHVANGTYHLENSFTEEKEFCLNRLPVAYVPDAPVPSRWLSFLNELLYPEDIPTLQEFIGYCLIPTNKAQKMLMMVGKGGEGKSCVGLVLYKLFGANMRNGSLHKLEKSRFAVADLQNRLLMVDDDLKMKKLEETNTIKTIVTAADMPLDLERKGVQSYEAEMYVRIMAFGNDVLQSLYDHSDGFFRRQIILTTKDKPKDRASDPFLTDKLGEEIEGILLWAIEGLRRLMKNRFHFTISDRARENLATAIKDGNNVSQFMESEGYFRFQADGEITSKEFYGLYLQWCEDNAVHPLASKTFSTYLNQREKEFNLEYTNKIHNRMGKRVWGYVGIETL